MKNNQYSSETIKKCCENKLELSFRAGKELNAKTKYNGKFIRVTVPKGKKNLPPKTYKSIAKQLYLSVSQLDELLDCDLKKEDFYSNLDSLS